MRYLLLPILLFSFFAVANYEEVSSGEEVFIQVDGEFHSIEANSTDVDELIENSFRNPAFYECKAVPGGYRRCSKRTGRCFGAVFKIKSQCEDVLNGDDDD